VNEDVFAYSNKSGSERCLVIYHNKFATAKGWIRTSAAYLAKTAMGEHVLVQKQLGEGLGLTNDPGKFYVLTDPINSLEYLRNCGELHEKGLYIELEAYKCQVFMNFREIQDNEWHHYANLAAYLNGRGVPSIDDALKELFLQPIHQAYRELVNPGFFRWVISKRMASELVLEEHLTTKENVEALMDEAGVKIKHLLSEIQRMTSGKEDIESITNTILQCLHASLFLPAFSRRFPLPHTHEAQPLIIYLNGGGKNASPWLNNDPYSWGVLLGWLTTFALGRVVSSTNFDETSRSWLNEWMLSRILSSTFIDLGLDDQATWRAVTLVKLLISHHSWWMMLANLPHKSKDNSLHLFLSEIFSDNDAQTFLGLNRYQGVLWFNKESFDELIWWYFIAATVEISSNYLVTDHNEEAGKKVLQCYEKITSLINLAENSGYMVEKFLDSVR
jgi:hypothetical protein